jgi:transcriptional regulator with XRE-family HTH domain
MGSMGSMDNIEMQKRQFGATIRRCRRAKKMENGKPWPLWYVAAKLAGAGWETTAATLSRIELGQQDIASGNIFRLAQVLEVPVEDLFRSPTRAAGAKLYHGQTLGGVIFVQEVRDDFAVLEQEQQQQRYYALLDKYQALERKYFHQAGLIRQFLDLMNTLDVTGRVPQVQELLRAGILG